MPPYPLEPADSGLEDDVSGHAQTKRTPSAPSIPPQRAAHSSLTQMRVDAIFADLVRRRGNRRQRAAQADPDTPLN